VLTFAAYAETISIYGFANNYKGRNVSLEVYDDYISMRTIKLAESVVSGADGSFMLEVELNSTREALLKIGQNVGIIYLSPTTKTYHVSFPEEQRQAEYLRTNYVELLFKDLPPTDINSLILDFNARLDVFLYADKEDEYSHLLDTALHKRLDTFKLSLPQIYKSVNDVYFYNYMRYTLASWELISQPSVFKAKLMVYNEHLSAEPVLYRHDMYMRLFNQFYDGELKSLSREKRNNLLFYINEGNYTKSLESIELLYTKRSDLREMALMKSLSEVYVNNEADKKGILTLLDSIQLYSVFPNNKIIATNLLYLLTKTDVGQQAPAFTLTNQKGEEFSLSDYKDKLVYLNFIASWCTECLTEMQAIKGIKERYGNMIEFITISVDEDLYGFNRYIEGQSQLKWNIAHFNYNYDLVNNYNVKSLPAYFLIDENGVFIQSPALNPIPKGNSASIDFMLFNLKKDKGGR
jgi:thiol-disulfide isomerase/thioredoxin